MQKSIQFLLILVLLATGVVYFNNQPSEDEFQTWKLKYRVEFQSYQEPYRRLIFQKNLETILKHNQDERQTYKMGLNQFSALTNQEFKQTYLMSAIEVERFQVNYVEKFQKRLNNKKDESIKLPEGSIDWTTQGKVSRIKNQGNCGSCWAFSTTGALQSYALFYNRQVDLSEQQLVDCSTRYGNNGCSGGYPMQAFKYVYQNGLASEGQYPYAARNQQCQRNGGNFRITNVYSFPGCNNLVIGLSAQPLSVTVDATNWSQYHSGVFNSCAANINHCVLLVGIDGNGNWKIKNSWGTGWGQNGFIRLQTGNTCGLCNYAGIYPR